MPLYNSHGVTVVVTAIADKTGYTGNLPDFTNIYDVSPPSGSFSTVNITAHDDARPEFKQAKMSSEFPTMSITTDYDSTGLDCTGTMCTVAITAVDDTTGTDTITFDCVITGADVDGSFTAGDSEFRRTIVNFDILQPAVPNIASV